MFSVVLLLCFFISDCFLLFVCVHSRFVVFLYDALDLHIYFFVFFTRRHPHTSRAFSLHPSFFSSCVLPCFVLLLSCSPFCFSFFPSLFFLFLLFFLSLPPPPSALLFPYPPLFRSPTSFLFPPLYSYTLSLLQFNHFTSHLLCLFFFPNHRLSLVVTFDIVLLRSVRQFSRDFAALGFRLLCNILHCFLP